MIVITGAAGFIGSCVANHISQHSEDKIVIVDDFSREEKEGNLMALEGIERVERSQFFDWVRNKDISAIIHLGARTDTTEFDYSIFESLNVQYSKDIWSICQEKGAKLIYASSAATYGDGDFGYDDIHDLVENLKPLNPYGISKNEFDKWVLNQDSNVDWYGLKFFNVYGPNEYHKGRMASVIFHAFNQISETGSMRLFRSHNPDYKDGGQLRDFVYVKDICSVIDFLLTNKPESGLYNLGTGEARTFEDLAKSVFLALDKPSKISYIDTPEDIRDKYQYFTEANMEKLINAGYQKTFTTLEVGVEDYVSQYLTKSQFY